MQSSISQSGWFFPEYFSYNDILLNTYFMRFFCTCIIICNEIKRIAIKAVIYEHVSALKDMTLLNE